MKPFQELNDTAFSSEPKKSGAARLIRRGHQLIEAMPTEVRPLVLLAATSCLWLVGCLAMQLLDSRQVMGVSTWVKPAKFAASIAVTSFTLAWLLRVIDLTATARRRVVAIIVSSFALELVLITVQGARGVPSHFNNATAVDAMVFSVMGLGIVVATLALGRVAVRAFRQRFVDATFGWGIRLGFCALLLGSAVGGIMPRPTVEQGRRLAAGDATPVVGAHSVGVEDGGPGLAVSGWSTTGGDLRVPHFMGLHGFQVIPLFAWWVSRRRPREGSAGSRSGVDSHPRPWVVGGGMAYIGLTATALVQALRGQSLLRPDGVTLALAAAAIAVSVLVPAAVFLLSRWRSSPRGRARSPLAPA